MNRDESLFTLVFKHTHELCDQEKMTRILEWIGLEFHHVSVTKTKLPQFEYSCILNAKKI